MKDPAFLFYTQDFITGTLAMPFEEKGKYITLLCYEHQTGRMSEETIRLLVGSVSDMLKSKFEIDENGLWFNKRLEIESEKRKKFNESRKNNGSLGGRPSKKEKPNKNLVKTDRLQLGKPNENLPENENKYIYTINNKEYISSIDKNEIEKIEVFEKFQFWMNKHAPRVLKMQEPITIEQMFNLKEDGILNDIGFEKLENMHNKATLLKDYVSANRTLRAWVRNEKTK